MIFNYIKYVMPGSYFNLKPKKDLGYFPTIEQIKASRIGLELDLEYESSEARERDLAYRAFRAGYISDKRENGKDIWRQVNLPISDQYRFLRKNFNEIWVVYVLILRIVTLNDPIKEVKGYLKSRAVTREKYSNSFIKYKDYEIFESKLISSNPLVSIIIPTLNRYEYLRNILKDFEKQSYKNFEVIIIDQSNPFDNKFYSQFNLDINLIYQEEPALWRARNKGVKISRSEIILFSEDDVRVKPNWIYEHLKCLDFFQADISNGVFFPEGNTIPKDKNYFKFSEQFATGNACIYKKVFEKTGLFDRTFEKQRMGDGEFGLRCYLNGFKSISNPIAFCLDVKAPTGGLRQMGSWDAFRPKKIWAPRPIPSVLFLYRKYFGKKAAILALVKNIPPSIIPYNFKKNKFFLLVGSIFSIVLSPIIIIQVVQSWRLSSRMLANNLRIESL